ncbi:MAG: class I SAM-dependent methyltransferase [Candidatus Contendobacter sp.]|nr:class I SAM-dependent methyltransferase [Candidatus Contendobacter sp.]MDG4558282.1 class I SAM-dependent methyltransferase [Candidatus Contendobacter sp.]
MNPVCDVAENYDQYFASQLYDQRYPRPNPSSFAIVAREIHEGRKKVLDFGCGNGRYAAPLLDQTDAKIVGCDISREAIDELSVRCARHVEAGQLRLVCGDLSVLINAMGRNENFDLAILMFGVLGHIFPRVLRQKTLATIRSLLRPGGRIVVTVPNAARRFLKQQTMAQHLVRKGHLEPGDILYERKADHVTVNMYYHLYSLEEFMRELEQQGFRLIQVGAESFLPESGIVKSTPLHWLDRTLTTIAPLRYAYGFLAVAETTPEIATIRAPRTTGPGLPG